MLIELFEKVFHSPFTFIGTFAIIFFCLVVLEGAVANIFRIVNRGLRTLNIICRGWPPAHLDADGDWKPEEEKESV